jgi:hypothetical protein
MKTCHESTTFFAAQRSPKAHHRANNFASVYQNEKIRGRRRMGIQVSNINFICSHWRRDKISKILRVSYGFVAQWQNTWYIIRRFRVRISPLAGTRRVTMSKMTTIRRHDTQHKGLIIDIQHNDAQHNDTAIMLNAVVLSVAIYLLLCRISLCWVSWRL